MQTAFYFFCCFSICTVFTQVQLSPRNQSIREMQQLLQSREFQKLPETERLKEIIREENGFVLLTDNYRIEVEKKYKPRSFLGPRQFELHFGPLEDI